MELIEKLKYLKEQFEIGNYGRVERTANILIESNILEFLKEGLIHKGYGFLYQNKEGESLECFDEVILRFPDEPLGYEGRFNVNLKIGEFISARNDAVKLLSFDEDNVDYINNIIVVDEHLNNYESVIEWCDKILTNYPDDDVFLFTRASAKLKVGHIEEAIQDYQVASEIDDIDDIDKAMIFNDIGYAYSKLGSFTKSIEFSSLALEYDNNPYTYNNLGYAKAMIGEVEEGLQLVDLSLEIDGTNSYAYKNRAIIFMIKGELEKAKLDLEKAKLLNYEVDYDNEVNELLEKLNNC